MCINLLSSVQKSQHRLTAVLALFEGDRPARVIAQLAGVSEATLYRWRTRVLDVLVDDVPGPIAKPEEVSSRPLAASPLPALTSCSLSDRRIRALTLQMHGAGMTDRGIVQHFSLLFGRPNAVSLGSIGRFIKDAGRIARTLLITLPVLHLQKVKAVAIDDIYLHGQGTKVTMEPSSGVVLDVRRWHAREAEVWELILSQFPHIRLLIGDGAKEFDAAAERLKLWRQYDLMHERQWWTQHVFSPLSRQEQAISRALEQAKKQGEKPALIKKLSTGRHAFEAAFYLAVQIEEIICALFRPLSPEGQIWTMHTAYDFGERALDLLAKRQAEPQIDDVMNRASKHFEQGLSSYLAFHHVWEDVQINLREGVTWSRGRAFEGLIQEREWQRKMHDPQRTKYEQWLCENALKSLQTEIDQAVSNSHELRQVVDQLLRRPLRSSSLVEAFNARIRVLQTARRNVSDELLGLAALQWNINTREDGPRKGTSPYKLLGVLASHNQREWWDVLLDEMEANDQRHTH